MSNQPFDNETPQAERKAIVRNDSYFARQQNTIDDAGGRYSKLNPAKITGSTPSPVPQQPTSSPWAQGIDQVTGPEPPLDIDLNFVGALGGASAPSAAIETAPLEGGGLSSTPIDDPPQAIRRRRV